MYASNSSLTSSESTTTPSGTYRKKKPAPQPPAAKELFPSDQRESSMLKSNNTLSSYHVRFKILYFNLIYFFISILYIYFFDFYFNRNKICINLGREKKFSFYSSTLKNSSSSSRTTPRARKTKPAPPPPMPTSTPRNISIGNTPNFDESPIIKLRGDDRSLNMWEDQKTNKDEANRNRQSGISCTDSSSYTSYTDKSIQGKWKRKKGPAPPRPIPHRRKV